MFRCSAIPKPLHSLHEYAQPLRAVQCIPSASGAVLLTEQDGSSASGRSCPGGSRSLRFSSTYSMQTFGGVNSRGQVSRSTGVCTPSDAYSPYFLLSGIMTPLLARTGILSFSMASVMSLGLLWSSRRMIDPVWCPRSRKWPLEKLSC